jgi:hypothetical protein
MAEKPTFCREFPAMPAKNDAFGALSGSLYRKVYSQAFSPKPYGRLLPAR